MLLYLARLEDTAKRRNLLKDEHPSPKIELDMNTSNMATNILRHSFELWLFDQSTRWQPLFHPIVLFDNQL